MSPLTTNDLHRIFKKLDLNGDGFVSLGELKCLLERFDMKTTKDELKTLVGKMELDLIDFLFLYQLVITPNFDEESKEEGHNIERDIAKAFKVYDLNGDGYISCEELEIILSRLGLWNKDCGKDCKSMIRVYDTNSDGVLDFEEFKNMMFLPNP